MRKLWLLVAVAFAGTAAWAAGDAPAAAGAKAAEAKKIQVLVVAGGHGYPVKPFRALFDGCADMACTFVDEKQGGEAFDDISRWPYDAVVLYNYEKKLSEAQRENFLKLLDRGVGLVILHHAIYGYRPWPEYQKIVGVTSWLAGAKDGVDLKIHVEDPGHPITKGLADFSITDEAYRGHGLAPGVHVLLTTDEASNAKAVAWVHTYRKSPVCYFQLGHDAKAYANPGFTAFLGQAIRWAAGRLGKAEAPAGAVTEFPAALRGFRGRLLGIIAAINQEGIVLSDITSVDKEYPPEQPGDLPFTKAVEQDAPEAWLHRKTVQLLCEDNAYKKNYRVGAVIFGVVHWSEKDQGLIIDGAQWTGGAGSVPPHP